MKKIILSLLILTPFLSFSQYDPVNWKFKAIKIDSTTYQIQIEAYIDAGWHIYSIYDESNLAIPTKITYNLNPLLKIISEIEEKPEPRKFFEPLLNIPFLIQDKEVLFIQRLKTRIKGIKTILRGKVNYQACTNERCLPPKTIDFSIIID